MGKLIVIEGLDGSGKGTQADLISSRLKGMGKKVTRISFPDYNCPSSLLAKMYLDGEFGDNPNAVNAYAAASFFAVDRYASYIKFWKDKYENGEIIICDRYVTSNAVYQMTKLDDSRWKEYIDWLYDYEYGKLRLPIPNLVLYLDVPISISQGLMKQRYDGDVSKKDIHERNTRFLEKCYLSAKYVLDKDKWHIIRCTDSGKMRAKEDINKEIFDEVKRII